MNARPIRIAATILIATLLAGPAPDANAQRLTPPELRRGADANLLPADQQPYETVRDRLAADLLARALNARLRGIPDPTPADYRVIAAGYRLAGSLVPDDEEMIRRESEAWTLANDERGVAEALRRLVEFAPDDTVSQLRLINNRIRRLQNADDRLAAYEVMLGPRGANLDAAIRSRLALDAALLARETGDDARALALLQEAMVIDITNKEAAALFAAEYLKDGGDPLERVEVLLNIILADPLDREAHLNLAFELMSHGAYKGALRFLDIATTLTQARREVLDVPTLFDILLVTWNVEGAEKCLEMTTDLLNNEQAREDQRRAEREASGLDPGPERQVRLPPNIELLNLAIHKLNDDAEGAQAAMTRMLGPFNERLDSLADKFSWPEGVTEENARRYRAETLLEMIWIRCVANLEIEEAAADLERLLELADDVRLEQDAIDRVRGWVAGRRGDVDAARELLTPLIDSDLNARLALAMIEDDAGDEQIAIRQFALVAADDHATLVSNYARRRLEQLIGTDIRPTPESTELNRYTTEFAPWIESFTKSAHAFLAVRVENVRGTIGLLDRVELRMRIRNVSRRALAVGGGKPIDPRFLLTPRLKVGGYDYLNTAPPEVFKLDRRLRLDPGEELDLTFWLGRGPVGGILDTTPSLDATLRWRVIQGYTYDRQQNFIPGYFGVTAESELLLRNAHPPFESTDAFLESLEQAAEHDLLKMTLIAAARLMPPTDGSQIIDRDQTLEGVAARLAEMAPREQAVAVLALGAANRSLFNDPALGEVMAAMFDTDDPILQLALALEATTVMNPEFLPRMARAENTLAARFAILMIDRLRRSSTQ